MRYTPETVQCAADALTGEEANLCCGSVPVSYWAAPGLARAVLDALVVDAPLVRQQHPGPVVLEWPNGFDPDADPTDGAQFLLVDVRLFARLVQRLNDAEESLHGVSTFIPSALTDDETQT